MQNICILISVLVLFSCRPESIDSPIQFTQPVKVFITGYNGNVMEPFITRDGTTLLFNNLNESPENTNLYWAVKINDSTFQYEGEVAGINTKDLEAVASLDNNGNLYFVSNRNYATTLSTLYKCRFSNGFVTGVQLVNGVSKLQPGAVNFDAEISADGQYLYFVDAIFNQSGNVQSADIVIGKKITTGFSGCRIVMRFYIT